MSEGIFTPGLPFSLQHAPRPWPLWNLHPTLVLSFLLLKSSPRTSVLQLRPTGDPSSCKSARFSLHSKAGGWVSGDANDRHQKGARHLRPGNPEGVTNANRYHLIPGGLQGKGNLGLLRHPS